ncbi:hypothetical protein ACFQT0_04275 [Hymenobacter humi]|uniref:PLAT domain-containing protein n=1 Tax=Hymenobacter humi TaxID=1411620 RepID=A0ABW2U1M2_9BACT
MKTNISAFVFFLFALFSYGTASAQHPNVKSPVTVKDIGTQLEIKYDISGLGNIRSTQATLTYDIHVETQCRNHGGNVAPGQSYDDDDHIDTFTIPVNNGRARGTYTTKAIVIDQSKADCPNGGWTAELADVTFSNVVFKIGGVQYYPPLP